MYQHFGIYNLIFQFLPYKFKFSFIYTSIQLLPKSIKIIIVLDRPHSFDLFLFAGCLPSVKIIVLKRQLHVRTYCGVLSQLAKGGEGLSMSSAYFLHDQAELCCQLVRLHDGHLHCFLLPLPLVSVVSYRWGKRMTQSIR